MSAVTRMRWWFNLLPRTITYFLNERLPWFYKAVLLLPALWYLTPLAHALSALPLLGLFDLLIVVILTLALFNWLSERYLRQRVRQGYDEQRPIYINEEEAGQTTYYRPPVRPLEIIEGEYYVIDRSQSQPQVYKKAS